MYDTNAEDIDVINSIIERHSKLTPLSETEIRIVRAAAKLFLEHGFSKTTQRMIAEESGIGLGTLTYHFRTKEDLLQLLIEELMDFHSDVIEETAEKTNDNLFSYAMEIAVQIALCENDKKAWDLYYSAYSHPSSFSYIKDWAAKKTYNLLGGRLPHLRESDFRNLENITSGIELAAFISPCDRYYTLADKIALTLDCMLKIYDVSAEERKSVIEKLRAFDYSTESMQLFEKFSNKLK